MPIEDSRKLEEGIGYVFKNKSLLKEALTHRSYINEGGAGIRIHNERLEFLGDAVLELIVTEELFNRFPEHPEGLLTPIRSALVNYQMLSQVGEEIKLHEYMLLSRGEAKDTGRARASILANAMEAVIGAIYLDGGYKGAKTFILDFVMPHLGGVMKKESYRDAKSTLQEKIQETMKITPHYELLHESGPDHEKEFTVGVFYDDKKAAEGSGMSKQEAEVKAAEKALEALE